MISIIFIISLAAPLILMPIEAILPYPAVIEELAKAAIAWGILSYVKKQTLKIAAVSAVCFSLSETIFYLPNFFTGGTASGFFLRIVCTTLFHCVTMVLFVFVGKDKVGRILFILPLAIILHFLYNLFVVRV